MSAFNDFCGNFRLTFAKKSGIAKAGQILELLCFFSCLALIFTKQSVSIFIMEYRFDNEFIFSHKRLLLLIEVVVTMGYSVLLLPQFSHICLVYAWDVLFWLS